MNEDACNVREEDGATLRGRRENGFGREEAQALGEDQSKINEQPLGLAVGLEGPGSSLMGDGVQGILGTMEAPSSSMEEPAAPPRSPSPCPRGLRLHSELQAVGLMRPWTPNGNCKYLPR